MVQTGEEYLAVLQASYDYEPRSEDEIAIKENQIMFLLEKADDDWWKVKIKGDSQDDSPSGLVPACYVKPAKYVSIVKALYDYDATAPGELSIKEDEILMVFDREDEWFLVQGQKEGSNAGFVPGNYVEEIYSYFEPGAEEGGLTGDEQEGEPAVALYDFEGVNPDELSVQEGERLRVIKEEKDWWKCRNMHDDEGVVPASYLESLGSSVPEDERECEETENKERETRELADREWKKAREEHAGAAATQEAPREQQKTKSGQSNSTSIRVSREHKNEPPPGLTRIWRDRTGQFCAEAALLGYTDGKIRLHKVNGVVIEVPSEKLSLGDLRYVERLMKRKSSGASSIIPQATSPSKLTRIWHDQTGQFRVEAALLGYDDGQLRLRKINGVVVEVPAEKMSLEDMQYVKRLMKRRTSDSPSTTPRASINDGGQPLASRCPTSAKKREPIPLQKKGTQVDWFEFFLSAGCDVDDCAVYAHSFESVKIDESLLSDIKDSTMRSLGLREGDIIRVSKIIQQKYAKPKALPSDHLASDEELAIRLQEKGNVKKPVNPAPDPFAGPGGVLKSNSQRHGGSQYSKILPLSSKSLASNPTLRSRVPPPRVVSVPQAPQVTEPPLAPNKVGMVTSSGHHGNAMPQKISQLPNPGLRERHPEYVNQEQAKEAIRVAIAEAIRGSPLVLINTDTGRLLDKPGQARLFELQPIFQELISSTTSHIDHSRIEREVTGYYRYATFSHKWEDNEPLFEQVIHVVVYELEESLTHNKLQMFCKVVRDAGIHWAWSDTCCINKTDHFELQEALVSMFKWYEGSAVTVVLLRGVPSPAKRGDLMGSVWNTRAWTLQEYHASKVVRFYTEDWRPYLDLHISNHKESSEIISEMEDATGVSSQVLMALRPGLDDIRPKLRLASARQTTRVEDAAYSLLGIFSMPLPVIYGEGDKALGRFLAQLLMSSGDTSILAWTGQSGSFNSCLPSRITVFNQLPTTHIPRALKYDEMDKIVSRLQNSSLDFTSISELYTRLDKLSVPSFVGQRMQLPCVIFQLGSLSTFGVKSRHEARVFRVQTTLLGVVKIGTTEDLSQFSSLYLAHPWVDFLLGRQTHGNVVETIFPEEHVNDMSPLRGKPLPRHPSYAESLRLPSSLSPMEQQMRALHVIARLRQPFGALLFAPRPGNVAACRRVAADSLITVQIEEITPTILDTLIDSVRTLDVL